MRVPRSRTDSLRATWERMRSAGVPMAAVIAGAVLLLATSACSTGDSVTDPSSGAPTPAAGSGILSVSLTDAPDTLLAAAVVHIGRVEAVPAEGDSADSDSTGSDDAGADSASAGRGIAAQQEENGDGGGPVVIVEEGGTFDLLTLRDGVTELLGSTEVSAGSYAQLRFIVDSARVELKEGLAFRDGSTSRSLKVPSGSKTGIKLNLAAADGDSSDGVVVEEGGETSLMVDFDVSQSFVVQGNPNTPAGIRGFLFKPVLRVVEEDAAGSVAGTVSGPEGTDVSGLTVTAGPAGESASARIVFQQQDGGGQTETATATTGEDGRYELSGLVPGTYEVAVEAPDGFTSDPASREVEVAEGETVESVDFTLVEDGTGS